MNDKKIPISVESMTEQLQQELKDDREKQKKTAQFFSDVETKKTSFSWEKDEKKKIPTEPAADTTEAPKSADMRSEDIRRIAQDIFAKRKDLDPGNQESEPSESDLRTAEGIYGTMQRQNGSPDKTATSKPEAEPGPAAAAGPEAKPEKTIDELKVDLDAKRKIYAQLDLDKSRKWARLKNLLGAGIKEVKDEDFDRAWGEYEEAKSKYFDAKRGEVLQRGDKEGAREFLREFEGADEATKFLNLKYDLKKEQSGYPAKALYGFEKLANGWKEMSWKKKLAISAAIFGLGAAVGLTGGASFGLLGTAAFTARTAQRILGAGAMYIGAKRWQDTRAMKKIQERTGENIEELLSDKNWIDRIANLEYGQHIRDRFWGQKEEVEALDKKHKRRALVLAGMIGIGGTAFDMYRQGYFGLIRDKAMGVGGAVKEKFLGGGASGKIIKEAVNQPATGEFEPSKDILYDKQGNLTKYGNEYFKQFDIEPHNSPPGSYDQYQKLPTAPEPEAKISGLRAPDAPEKIAGLKNILLGFDDIKKSGGIERSAQAIMRQDPEQFGFKSDDPKLNLKIGQKAHLLARDMAKSMGFEGEEGLKEFNKLASQRVQEGDQIRLFKDPSGNLNMEYSGKAFGGVDVVSSESPVQDAAGTRAGVVPEEMKPKAGAGVAEQQPTRARGAGKMKFSPEIEEMDRKAQASAARAFESQQYADDYRVKGPEIEQARIKAALAQVGPTRGLLNNIVTDAGIGNKGYFWGQPIGKFNELVGEDLFAGEASEPDAVDKINSSKVRLRRLFEILKNYSVHAGETTDECLQKALLDSRPIRGGKLGESVGSRMLQLINKDVLGK